MKMLDVTVKILTVQESVCRFLESPSGTIQEAVDTAKSLKSLDVPTDTWHVVSAGSVHTDRLEHLSSIAVNNAVHLVLVPPSNSFVPNENELYAMAGKVVDLHFCNAPNQEQKEGSAMSLSHSLSTFVGSLSSGGVHSIEDLAGMKSVMEASIETLSTVDERNDHPIVQWFEAYGCALITRCAATCMVHISLVCVDSWEFYFHPTICSREHSSKPSIFKPVTLPVGSFSEEKLPAFKKLFPELLEEACFRRQDRRTAAGGSQGHQKTPGFIQAILLDAIYAVNHEGEKGKKEHSPRGGLTDVGLHTGGHPKNVAWPLLIAVIQSLVEVSSEKEIVMRFIVQLYLRLAESVSYFLVTSGAVVTTLDGMEHLWSFNRKLNTVMQCMSECVDIFHSVQEGTLLRWEGEMEACEVRSIRIRHELEEAVGNRATIVASHYKLRPTMMEDLKWRDFQLNIPRYAIEGLTMKRSTGVCDLVRANVGLFPVPFERNASLPSLNEWLEVASQSKEFENIRSKVSYCRCIETVLFYNVSDSDDVIPESEVPMVVKIVDKYRDCVLQIRDIVSTGAMMGSELESKAVLVVWAALCIVHKVSMSLEPELRLYSLPLLPSSLHHITLSERRDVEAMLALVQYISGTQNANNRPIFSGSPEDATSNLALAVSQKSIPIQQIISNEKENAALRSANRWKVVQEKKRRLPVLDEELKDLRQEHGRQEARTHEAKNNWDGAYKDTDWWTKCEIQYQCEKRMLSAVTESVRKKNTQIQQEEQAPAPIYQPLPKQENVALTLAFYLFMPHYLRVLGDLCFLSQQMLLPTIATGFGDPNLPKSSPNVILADYYNYKSTSRAFSATSSDVVIGSKNELPERWFSNNVRTVEGECDGVWYPDSLLPELFWAGGHRQEDKMYNKLYFNPFGALSHDSSIARFVEKMPSIGSSMQWATKIPALESPYTRENRAEASQGDRPAWIVRKDQFLIFASLRSHPLSQFRKLCAGLLERNIDLETQCGRILIRQTLYHVGEILLLPSPSVEFLNDQEEFGGWKFLCNVLKNYLGEIQNKPREYLKVVILSEIACYASQWEASIRDLCRDLSSITETWADSMKEEQIDASEAKSHPIRARRRLFYMYSIICHSNLLLSTTDVTQILKCHALQEYHRIFECETEFDAEIKRAELLVKRSLAKIESKILEIVDENPSLLTDTMRVLFETAPETLEWNKLTVNQEGKGRVTSSWSGRSSDGCMYSINVMTGVVLVNGVSPRRLPNSITSSASYMRSFNDASFEVFQLSTGGFQTVRKIKGRFYRFHDSQGKPIIQESESGQFEEPLELMDGTEMGTDLWAANIPARLRTMHSHWLCREEDKLFLRPIHFSERKPSYIMILIQSSEWKCVVLPTIALQPYGKSDKYLGSTDPFDRMVHVTSYANSNIHEVLERVEDDNRFIHSSISQSGFLLASLPRFGLEFEVLPNGSVECKTFPGYRLCVEQQLRHTMFGFSRYIVVEKYGRRKVLIPSGKVVSGDREIGLEASNVTVRNFHLYDVHPRFGTIDACAGERAIEARLQLAAIYGTNGSLLPEKSTWRTSGEISLELLRQSWSSKPYNQDELLHISTLQTASTVCPSVSLLCLEIQRSSEELKFLHSCPTAEMPSLDEKAGGEYLLRKRKFSHNWRSSLSQEEELQIFGESFNYSTYVPEERFLEPSLKRRSKGLILEWEKLLRSFLSYKAKDQITMKGLPSGLMPGDESGTKLFQDTMHQLEESVNIHRRSSIPFLRDAISVEIEKQIQSSLEKCSAVRRDIEFATLASIRNVPGHHSARSRLFNINRAVNRIPFAGTRDFLAHAYRMTKIADFNPFLSKDTSDEIVERIMQWLEFCVWEDKLNRLSNFVQDRDEEELVHELSEVGREWEVRDHSQWLAFEVENCLQIRHRQYVIAQFCIENSDMVTQLNMGEGKTRVIIPMVILQDTRTNCLVRLNVLKPLLSEAYHYLHRSLTASVVCRRLCLLPFHRGIEISLRDARLLHCALRRCLRTRTVACVAPEQRLSLGLKWHELGSNRSIEAQEIRNVLQKITDMKVFDIFDECDELLSHKYQLVYAMGNCISLPSCEVRWLISQAAIRQFQINDELRQITANVEKRSSKSSTMAGSFDDVRLLSGEDLDNARQSIMQNVAEGIFSQPPDEFRWLQLACMRPSFLEFVTNPSKDISWLVEQVGLVDANVFQMTEHRMDVLLVLRGLLAYHLLENALLKRYRVDYGIDPRRGVNRRVAVPYRASDMPSDRSEYAQPDILITLTQLAYYHRGLSKDEVHESILSLLQLGPIAQKFEFSQWYESGKRTMTPSQIRAVDNVEKLDPSSDILIAVMYDVYHTNMSLIDFWLKTCVFPRETMQFPHRLSANAFNLAENADGALTGFSGTKDRHLLMPIQVRQQSPKYEPIQATDGKMYDKILESDRIHIIPEGVLSDKALRMAIELDMDAIIDAGATMAGMKNADVANKIISISSELGLTERRKGLVFYEQDLHTWVAMSWDRRRWPLGSAPIHERDAVVYFDESHCRGADMKLKKTARALVTVGPSMAKEKLMQAVGRMRKLDLGQKVSFALPMEISKCMTKEQEHSHSKDLLRWVLRNSIEANKDGLTGWAHQGIDFCTTLDPRSRLTDEVLLLEKLYGSSRSRETVETIAKRHERMSCNRLASMGVEVMKIGSKRLLEVRKHIQKYGSDYNVFMNDHGEELEREIEHERELNTEREISYPSMIPREPFVWPYDLIQKCQDVSFMPNAADVIHMSEASKTWTHHCLHQIKWDACRLYGTRNFFMAISSQSANYDPDLSEYLRPVDGVLFFLASGSFVLLSEHETGEVLRSLRSYKNPESKVVLLNFSQMKSVVDCTHILDCEMRVPQVPKTLLENSSSSVREALALTLAGLRLFAGLTEFQGDESRNALKALLPKTEAKKSAIAMVKVRGLGNMLARSYLQEVCNESD